MLKIILKIGAVLILLFVTVKAQTDENNLLTKQAEEYEEIDVTEDSLSVLDLFRNIDVVNNNDNKFNDSRVNGGQVVTKIVPFQVSLQAYRRNRWRHFCGGSIISSSHVLTAAHCVDKMKPEDIHIVAGTLIWNSGGQRHRASAKRVHPKFSLSPRIINDIAVLKVQPAFNLHRNNIGTISLGSTSRIRDRIKVRVTGWGSTSPTAATGLPDKLQQLDYQTITNEECGRKGFRVTQNEICALSVVGQGSCMGDSGGPLINTQGPAQLVGVVSYGSATCAQGRPDVYSRVSSFLPYITKVITSEIP
ncbi:chymotrypsin-2 [Lucilia cuprina]|uniref:chymotrypsin-2 n=1 Tax=Lucilia cuprina TaxID=7375 RepID=UPI001F0550CA|nr:chymotrypsin-2 [Lucilia cuprina]